MVLICFAVLLGVGICGDDENPRAAFFTTESIFPDVNDAVGDGYGGQRGAFGEGPISDAGHAVRDRDRGQGGAAGEGVRLNTYDVVWDFDGCQGSAAGEHSKLYLVHIVRDIEKQIPQC